MTVIVLAKLLLCVVHVVLVDADVDEISLLLLAVLDDLRLVMSVFGCCLFGFATGRLSSFDVDLVVVAGLVGVVVGWDGPVYWLFCFVV